VLLGGEQALIVHVASQRSKIDMAEHIK
jgi:hypothetical protein